MKNFTYLLWSVVFWSFIVIKVWGTAFATWSWWWLLATIVPMLWLIYGKAGLL